MRSIPLSQNKFALIDDEWYRFMLQWEWSYGNGYAIRMENGRAVKMHRVITAARIWEEVDHRDGNGLNNQGYNLRVCTHLQNSRNQKLSKANTSGYKGVYLHKLSGKWRALIRVNGKCVSLGYHDDPIQAALAYDEAAIKNFGEFAKTNFELGTLRELEVRLAS